MNGGRLGPGPFPGLRPFEAKDQFLFFGRDAQTDELLTRLGRMHFVAVVGTSASGKSSLVRAGVLPALNGGFMAEAGSKWRVATMRPESGPLASLAQALENAGALGDESDAALRVGLARAVLDRGALGLVEIARQSRRDPAENLLVFVDQFEELFRFKRDPADRGAADEAAAFVKLLIAAAGEPGAQIYVLITMRSDFLGDCSQFSGLPEAINDGLYLVPRLTREQVRDAIEGPIAVGGAEITPRLVNRLLSDLADDADQLPVLQHALMRTWEIWQAAGDPDAPLDIRHYEATGGLAEALSRHGDEIYAALPSDRIRLVAERIFKALTEAGTDNRGVRRPTSFADLATIANAQPDEVRNVVDAFRKRGVSFLMPPARTPLETGTTIDITHESLMRVWKRLCVWVEEEAESAQIYRRLCDAAAMYARGEAGLLRDDVQLLAAQEWRDQTRPTALWAERYQPGFASAMRLLDDSLAARDRENAQGRRRVVATIAILLFAVIAFGGLSFYTHAENVAVRNQLAVAESERLARLDRQLYEEHTDAMNDSGLDPTAMEFGRATYLLAAAAYARSPSVEAAEMLLLGVSHHSPEETQDPSKLNFAIASNEIPAWSLHALAAGGDYVAVITGTRDTIDTPAQGDLLLLDARDLSIVSRTPNVRASALCGFVERRELAISDGDSVRFYNVSVNAPAVLERTVDIGPVRALGCGPGRRAFALTAGGAIHAIDADGSDTIVGNLTVGAVSGIAIAPDGSYAAVVACAPAGLARCAATALHVVDLRSKQVDAIVPVRDMRLNCAVTVCAVAVAFHAPDKLFWYDAHAVMQLALGHPHRPPLRLSCTTSNKHPCDPGPLAIVGNAEMPTLISVGERVSVATQEDANSYTWRKESPNKNTAGTGPLPLIDPQLGIYISDDGGTYGKSIGLGIASHSLDYLVDAPMRTVIPSTPTSFGLADSRIILPEQNGPVAVELDRAIGAGALTIDFNPEVILNDAADNRHGAVLDLRTGNVDLIDISRPVTRVERSFHIDPASFGVTPGIAALIGTDPTKTPAILKQKKVSVHISLDAAKAVLTIRSRENLQRYDTNAGRLLSVVSWPQFFRRAHLPNEGSPVLSYRGNYVVVHRDVKDDVLMTSTGAVVGMSRDVSVLTADENIALVQTKAGFHALYAVPSWKLLSTIALTDQLWSTDIAPDGKTIAYATKKTTKTAGTPVVAWDIRLYDVGSRLSTIAGLTLPVEPDKITNVGLNFSLDGRYLIVQFSVKDIDGLLMAVYAIEPRAWLKQLCLMSGHPLTPSAFKDVAGPSFDYTDGCAPFEKSAMYPETAAPRSP